MTRVLSALLLIPVVLGVVWFLPPVGNARARGCRERAGRARVHPPRGRGRRSQLPRALTMVTVVAGCVAVGQAAIPPEIVVLGAVVLIGSSVTLSGVPGPDALPRAAAAMFAPAYIGFPLGAVAAIRTHGGPGSRAPADGDDRHQRLGAVLHGPRVRTISAGALDQPEEDPRRSDWRGRVRHAGNGDRRAVRVSGNAVAARRWWPGSRSSFWASPAICSSRC